MTEIRGRSAILHLEKSARCRKFSAKWIVSTASPVYISHHDTEIEHICGQDRRHVVGDAAMVLRAPIGTAGRQRRRFRRVKCVPASTERLTEPRRAQARAGFFIVIFAMGRLVVVWAQTPPLRPNSGGLVSSGQVERGDNRLLSFINFRAGRWARLILARSAR